MVKQFKTIFVTITLFMLSSVSSVYAVIGIGDTVFDASAYTQQLINYVLQGQQYYTQMKQYSDQMKQLQNDYTNLHNLGYKADLSDLSQMQNTMHSAIGMSNDYSKMQGQFQKHYPDFVTYKGQNGTDFAQLSTEWSRNNQKNALDMLTVSTKLQESIKQDQNTLRYLNNRSDTASGTKDLLQTMNQLLVLQTKQLMQLQQLIATSAKADAAYLAERASNDEASRAASDNIYRDWTKKGSRTPAPEPWDVLK